MKELTVKLESAAKKLFQAGLESVAAMLGDNEHAPYISIAYLAFTAGIVERDRGSALLSLMARHGLDWVTLPTETLLKMYDELGPPPVPSAAANPELLAERQANLRKFYETPAPKDD